MKKSKAAPCTAAVLLMAFIGLDANAQEGNSAASKPNKKDPSVYAELSKAPEKARAKHNPLEKDPDSIPAGRNLFEQHCAECHGSAAEGGKKGPSLRAPEVQSAEPGAIFWILTNGVVRKGMPVWSKLPEPQRWQLVTFIKSLGLGPAKAETAQPAKSTSPTTTDSPSPRR